MEVQIKERSLMFSGEMVRAVLDGRKVQTRRIMKPQPTVHDSVTGKMISHESLCGHFAEYVFGECMAKLSQCPYGRIGDHLRISEAVTVGAPADFDGETYSVKYHADSTYVERYGDPELIAKIRAYKRPHLRGVHLPPVFARDWRGVVTDVRVERLQEITRLDIAREGWPCNERQAEQVRLVADAGMPDAGIDDASIEWYANLWESLNGPNSWAVNPWVWIISFKRIEN